MAQFPLSNLMDGTKRFYVDANYGASSSDTITRPNDTTAYAAGDVCSIAAGEILEFANIGVANQLLLILGVRLRIDAAAIPSGMDGFRLHLYNAAPTAIADNAAYNLPSGDRAKYLGYIELNSPIDLGDTLESVTDNINFSCKLASTTLYGILQTIGAYTPTANCVKTVTINATGI